MFAVIEAVFLSFLSCGLVLCGSYCIVKDVNVDEDETD